MERLGKEVHQPGSASPCSRKGEAGAVIARAPGAKDWGPVCPRVAALPPQSSSSSPCKSPMGGTGRGSLAISALPTASLALKP